MALQRPSATIEVGGGGGGGLAGAVASLTGGGTLGFPEAAVLRLTVDQSVDTSHDRLVLELSALSPLVDTEPGSRIAVALGYGDELDPVATAEVLRVDATPSALHVVGYAPSRRRSNLHVARSYVSRQVGDVVADLLGEAGVEPGQVEGSQDLPAYHLDGTRSAWAEIHRLAGRTGSQVTSSADGAVSFAPAPGSTASGGLGAAVSAVASAVGLGSATELRRGASLIGWRRGPRGAEPDWTPAVAALGAASPFGPDRWHHFLKEPSSGSEPFVVDPALRSSSAGDAATAALADAARRRTTNGRLEVPGDPTLRAGGTATIDDTSYRLLRVRHLVDPVLGYRCLLTVEGAG
jgi:hypothetical protein